jgi:hypothetical protein
VARRRRMFSGRFSLCMLRHAEAGGTSISFDRENGSGQRQRRENAYDGAGRYSRLQQMSVTTRPLVEHVSPVHDRSRQLYFLYTIFSSLRSKYNSYNMRHIVAVIFILCIIANRKIGIRKV